MKSLNISSRPPNAVQLLALQPLSATSFPGTCVRGATGPNIETGVHSNVSAPVLWDHYDLENSAMVALDSGSR